MVSRTPAGWRFLLIRPRAGRAYLVGDFNGWSTAAIQMQPGPDGQFEATLDLDPGTYRFRYFVDGVWMIDYAAFGLERNAQGQWDSVLFVPADSPAPRSGFTMNRKSDPTPAETAPSPSALLISASTPT